MEVVGGWRWRGWRRRGVEVEGVEEGEWRRGWEQGYTLHTYCPVFDCLQDGMKLYGLHHANLLLLSLPTVLPLVPIVPQNQTVSFTRDGDVDGPTQWTCTVVGSTQDRLEWVHDGEPVPVVSNNTSQDLNCSTFNLSSSYVTEAEEEEIGRYKTRYQLTLHFCNSTERDVGSYQCVLHRWNGVMEPVLEVKLQRPTDEVPTALTTAPTTVTTGSSFTSASNPSGISHLSLVVLLNGRGLLTRRCHHLIVSSWHDLHFVST